jgi:hypothetical protein
LEKQNADCSCTLKDIFSLEPEKNEINWVILSLTMFESIWNLKSWVYSSNWRILRGISRHRSNVELLVGHKATKGNDQT